MSLWNPLSWFRSTSIPIQEVAEPFGAGIDKEGEFADRLFRSVRGRAFRDLSEHRRERALRLVWWMYLGYPLANRGLNIIRDFVTGEGLTFRAADPAVQGVLETHWKDAINNWPIKQHDKALEIFMFGEQFWPVFVNSENGAVRLGYIDPLNVAAVIPDLDNVEVARWVVLKPHPDVVGSAGEGLRSGGTSGTYGDLIGRLADPDFDPDEDPLWLRIIQPDDDPESQTFGRLVGDVFFFKVNSCSSCVRGNSSLLNIIDWIETHEQFLFAMQEAAILKNSMVWDVTVDNAKQKDLERFAEKFGRIKSGVTRFHSSSVTIKNITPDLGTSELDQHASMVKRHIAAGLGIPAHWLSEPEGANRAVALEMGQPTTKSLRAKQRVFRDMIARVFEFVIDQAIIHGTLTDTAEQPLDRTFKIITPPIWAVDVQQIAASLQSLAQALMLAEQSGWITKEEARATFNYTADQLGMETSTFDNASRGGEEDGSPDEPLIPGLTDFKKNRMNDLVNDALAMSRNVPGMVAGANGSGGAIGGGNGAV